MNEAPNSNMQNLSRPRHGPDQPSETVNDLLSVYAFRMGELREYMASISRGLWGLTEPDVLSRAELDNLIADVENELPGNDSLRLDFVGGHMPKQTVELVKYALREAAKATIPGRRVHIRIDGLTTTVSSGNPGATYKADNGCSLRTLIHKHGGKLQTHNTRHAIHYVISLAPAGVS